MKRLEGGYTVIEVMIFLIISSFIFASAAFVFNGQQGKTAFEQGVRDLNSQLQKYVNEIGTTVFNSGTNYVCSTSAATGRAVLSTGSSAQGTNQDCIFLGRAVQVVPTQQKIFIYSVLGNKNTTNNEPVTSFKDAMPTPALDTGFDLTDEYAMSWGKLSSSKVTNTANVTSDSDLVGFYNSLQDGYQNSGVGGAQSIFAKGYNYINTDLSSARSVGIKSCIEEQNANGVSCTNTPTINKWEICLTSVRSDQTALLSITNNPAGISTNVSFVSCT